MNQHLARLDLHRRGRFSLFSGGYVGVDVFFVISGYLITGILISDLERDSFSIARFYERRARRILPALFVVMLACLPFAWLWISRMRSIPAVSGPRPPC